MAKTKKTRKKKDVIKKASTKIKDTSKKIENDINIITKENTEIKKWFQTVP